MKSPILTCTLLFLAGSVGCAAPASTRYAREQPTARAAEIARMRETAQPLRRAGLTAGDPATASAEGRVTVEDCIADAMRRSPELEAALLRWNQASARVDVVTAYPDPVLRLGWMPEPIETRLGPTQGRVGVMQKIPWPGKVDQRGRVQAAQAEVLRLDLRARAWRIATDIRIAYADLIDVDRETELTRAELALLESWREIVRSRLELGRARTSDSMQLDVRVQRLEEEVRANAERRRAVLARLNALRSRPADTEVLPVEAHDPEPPGDLDVLLALARTRNPEIERRRQMHRAACEGVRLADVNRFVDPTLGAEYVIVGDGPLTQFSDNGRDAVGLSLSIPLPIQQRSRNAERLAARMGAAAASKEEAAYTDRLRGELAVALHGYAEARSREASWRDQVLPLVERQIEVGLEEYASGRGSMTDLMKYEAERLRVLQDIRRVRTQAFKKRAHIDHAVGVRVGPNDAAPGGA